LETAISKSTSILENVKKLSENELKPGEFFLQKMIAFLDDFKLYLDKIIFKFII